VRRAFSPSPKTIRQISHYKAGATGEMRELRDEPLDFFSFRGCSLVGTQTPRLLALVLKSEAVVMPLRCVSQSRLAPSGRDFTACASAASLSLPTSSLTVHTGGEPALLRRRDFGLDAQHGMALMTSGEHVGMTCAAASRSADMPESHTERPDAAGRSVAIASTSQSIGCTFKIWSEHNQT
jgi:hypothetical protein